MKPFPHFTIITSTVACIILSLTYPTAANDKVALTNGPLVFTDSSGASWISNNLTLTVDPGVVNYPFAQVGSNFPNGLIPREDSLLPPDIIGLEFTTDFDPRVESWVFAIATYDLPYTGNNTGVVFVCNTCTEPVGQLHTGYIDKLTEPTNRNVKVIHSSNGKIRLDLDHEFFRSADAYSMGFLVTPASPLQQITSFGFADIKWITHQ
jgi:hypothetical protein